MPEYRIYFTDQDAHISRPPELLECADDEAAIQKTRQYIDGKDIELWNGGRVVAKFPHKPEK